MNHCIAFHEHIELVMEICDDARLPCCNCGIYEYIWEDRHSRAGGEDLKVVCGLVIQPAYLWLWVIRYCELLAASLLMAVLYVPFQLAVEHNLPDISMETFNDPATRQHVTAETCSSSRLSYLPGVLSVSLIRLIRLSLYESSIRSSIPTSYGSLALYLSYSTKEKLCVKSPVLLLHILGFSLCQCHSEVLEGDSWFVAELQWNMQCFWGVSEWVCECVSEGEEEAAVLPTLPPITWADCRAEREAGRRPFSPFIRTSLQMVCWECCLIWMLRGWTVPSGSKVHRFIHAVQIIRHAVWDSDLSLVVVLWIWTLSVCHCLQVRKLSF